MKRDRVTEAVVVELLGDLEVELRKRIAKHGDSAFSGPHELLGICLEEFDELVGAVQDNDPIGVTSEAFDLAVAALWGVASSRARAAVSPHKERAEADAWVQLGEANGILLAIDAINAMSDAKLDVSGDLSVSKIEEMLRKKLATMGAIVRTCGQGEVGGEQS